MTGTRVKMGYGDGAGVWAQLQGPQLGIGLGSPWPKAKVVLVSTSP